MISEIFLHIGLHKTGTTSIQNTLFFKKNSKLLEDHGYLYPKHWPANHSIPIFSIFCDFPEKYHINIKKEYSINEIKKVNEVYLESLEKEIKKTKYSKLIISGEDISKLSFESLSNLRNYFLSTFGSQIKFNIVIYVRNPISRSVSAIQENVKLGVTQQSAMKIVLNQQKHYFQKRIKKFTQVFEGSLVKVYSFEESIKHELGPVGHFLSLLNIKNDEISKFHYIRSNESMSLIGVKFLSYVNMKIPPIIDNKLQENRTVKDMNSILNIRGPKYDLPYTDKKAIFENSQDDVNWLRNNFGINYSLLKPSKNQKSFELTEEIIYDLKNTFKNLSYSLQPLLKEFLQQYCDDIKNEKIKKSILKLLDELEN